MHGDSEHAAHVEGGLGDPPGEGPPQLLGARNGLQASFLQLRDNFLLRLRADKGQVAHFHVQCAVLAQPLVLLLPTSLNPTRAPLSVFRVLSLVTGFWGDGCCEV